MPLAEYQRKRNFAQTREPRGKVVRTNRRRFMVQEHHASRLHFDFRLEMGGVLKSWAVPKGPSLDPRDKRLAVQVEDHPVSYFGFEGTIKEGNYGAGDVRVWDSGTYTLVEPFDALEQLAAGKLSFILRGKKLNGEFTLVRMDGEARSGDKPGKQWLLIKKNDPYAQAEDNAQPLLSDSGRPRRRAKRAPSVRKVKVRGQAIPVDALFRRKKLTGAVSVNVDGSIVALSSLDKVFFPAQGQTKGDLLRYYHAVSATLLPYLRDRPLILKRYPNGVNGKFFFQHDADVVPDYIDTFTTTALGHTVDYFVANNEATLLYLVNLGMIPVHPWHSTTRAPDRPTWIVFDLDPGEVQFATVRQLALGVKRVLDDLGLDSYPKTSGARGMHIYVPIAPKYDYDAVAKFAEDIARRVVAENPEIATVVRALQRRKPNQIYVDHLQNARGKTIVAPYSVREREGATVSAPLTWDEVADKVTPAEFTIETMPRRIAKRGDLFAEVLTNQQPLTGALKRLQDAPPPKRQRAKP